MRFGKPAGLVLAALLLGGAPQPERGILLTQTVAWVQSLWEAVAPQPGQAAPGPQAQPTSDPDQGAHIDPNG